MEDTGLWNIGEWSKGQCKTRRPKIGQWKEHYRSLEWNDLLGEEDNYEDARNRKMQDRVDTVK